MTADRHQPRRAIALIALSVLAVVAAFTLTAGPASADVGTLTGTRVAASNLELAGSVGPIADISAGEGRETAADSYDNALGCCVATKATGPRSGGPMKGDTGRVRAYQHRWTGSPPNGKYAGARPAAADDFNTGTMSLTVELIGRYADLGLGS